MNRKQFLKTFTASLFAFFLALSAFGQSKMLVKNSDNYYGNSKKIKKAMKNGVIPEDFPNSKKYTSKKAFKEAVIEWKKSNENLIKKEALKNFETKLRKQQ